jgi:hypothetical protein
MPGQLRARVPLSGPLCKWARYDRYEIRHGCIRPTLGASLHWFDPWSDYEIEGRRKRAQPPYQSLFVLLDELELPEQIASMVSVEPFVKHYWSREEASGLAESLRLSQVQKRAILAWCSQWGLLGILPNETLAARFAARWQRIPDPEEVELNDWCAVQLCLSRLNGSWHRSVASTSFVPCPEDAVDGGVVSFNWCEDEITRPYVIVQRVNELGEVEIRHESPEVAWGDFFPGIPKDERNTDDYFIPGTAEFWPAYGEPVHEFFRYAALFRAAINELKALQEAPAEGRIPLLSFFQAAGGEVVVRLQRGFIETRWVYPSLLSLFAQMACQDVQAGLWEHRCLGCGKPFISGAYQARYCSAPCQWKDNRRRLRQKKADPLRRRQSKE